MAFLAESGTRKYFFLDRYIGSETGEGGLKEFIYITTDYASALWASGYFDIDYKQAITPGDTIKVYRVTDRNDLTTCTEKFELLVTDRSASTITVQQKPNNWISVDPGPREWRAEWFGLVDSSSTDQSAFLDRVMDEYDPDEGAIELRFPPWHVKLNGGSSDVPWEINKNGVHLRAHPGTTFIKGAIDRALIVVGTDDFIEEGERIEDFSFTGGTFDGQSLADTTDDYPALQLLYVDGGRVENVKLKNLSTGVRFGLSQDSGWSMANRRSLNCHVEGVWADNIKYFPIEIHGCEDFSVKKCRIDGGALSDTTDALGIRIARSLSGDIAGNIIVQNGRGIGTSSESGVENQFLTFRGNIIRSSTYSLAFSLSGPHKFIEIVGNLFYGAGDSGGQIVSCSAGGLGTMSDIVFAGNSLISTRDETNSLALFDECNGLDIIGNRFRNLGVASTGTKRMLQINECLGLVTVMGNAFDYDFGRGVDDVSGAASLKLVVKGNTFRGPSVASTLANAVTQTTSSGTITLGGMSGDDNTYLDA